MNLHSGVVVNRNLHANYVLQGNRVQILDTASVPLRLTRNVSTLLGPYWEEGSFKYTLGALALVGEKREEVTRRRSRRTRSTSRRSSR